VDDVELDAIATLLADRNAIDEKMAAITRRPMTSGHLGEWIAARVFGIELESSASAAAIDGRFTCGPLAGRSVNVKWYLKREGLLDLVVSDALDYYLVLSGPRSAASSSRGQTRPWCITSVHLFDAKQFHSELGRRGISIGAASSVRNADWDASEIYPRTNNSTLPVDGRQLALLRRLDLTTSQA
jgi:hypothetical protein